MGRRLPAGHHLPSNLRDANDCLRARGSELTYDLAEFQPGTYRARIYVGPSYAEPEFTMLTPLVTVPAPSGER